MVVILLVLSLHFNFFCRKQVYTREADRPKSMIVGMNSSFRPTPSVWKGGMVNGGCRVCRVSSRWVWAVFFFVVFLPRCLLSRLVVPVVITRKKVIYRYKWIANTSQIGIFKVRKCIGICTTLCKFVRMTGHILL